MIVTAMILTSLTPKYLNTACHQHFIRLAAAQNLKIEVIAELKYELPKVHKFHKQKSKDIEVDLYRFTHLS